MPLSLEEQIDISVARKGQRQEVWAHWSCYFHGQNYPYNNTVYKWYYKRVDLFAGY